MIRSALFLLTAICAVIGNDGKCPEGPSCVDCFTVQSCDDSGHQVTTICPEDTPYCKGGICGTDFNLTCRVCTERYSCLSCHEALVCDSSGRGVEQVRCGDLFCSPSSGTCGYKPDANPACINPSGGISCESEGYFPDPNTNSIYHVFKNNRAVTFDCSPNIYDPKTEKCIAANQPALKDSPVDCSGNIGFTMVPFSNHKMFYTYCLNGKAVMVGRCQNDYVLNQQTQECEAVRCGKDCSQ